MLKARTVIALAALALGACTSPESKMKEADEAQSEANKKSAEINQKTLQKEAEIQRKADEDIARLSQEAATKIDAAQRAAAEKNAEANEALLKARAAERAAAERHLDNMEKDVPDLRVKLERKLSSGEVQTITRDIDQKAAAVRSSITSLETTSAENLDAARKAIDARLTDLDHAISDAKARL